MEHLSRRTTRDVDLLLIVSDPTLNGIRAARRIQALVRELDLSVRQMALILNRTAAVPAAVAEEIAAGGLRLAGLIPEDPRLAAFELEGRALLELPDDTPAVRAVEALLAAETAGVPA
jgi:CO dehydrogenase maturation factor